MAWKPAENLTYYEDIVRVERKSIARLGTMRTRISRFLKGCELFLGGIRKINDKVAEF